MGSWLESPVKEFLFLFTLRIPLSGFWVPTSGRKGFFYLGPDAVAHYSELVLGLGSGSYGSTRGFMSRQGISGAMDFYLWKIPVTLSAVSNGGERSRRTVKRLGKNDDMDVYSYRCCPNASSSA